MEKRAKVREAIERTTGKSEKWSNAKILYNKYTAKRVKNEVPISMKMRKDMYLV